MQLSKDGQHTIIIYSEHLTISDMQSQQAVYQKALASAKSILLQAAAVISIDTASLQLLLSFLIAAKQKEIPYQWQACSPALLEVARLAGVVPLLELTEQAEIK